MLGIFDSGVGGLTVVKELLRRHPEASFEYLGDTARSPYGTKGGETIIRYALEDAAFLVARGASAIIVACNTVSAHALDALRSAYPALPIIDVIEPAVRVAAASSRGRVGVIGTRATISSGVYESKLRAIRPEIEVVSVACPLFVPLVEEGWLDDPVTKEIAARYLAPLKDRGIDTLVLGCTHYPLLRSIIQDVMGGDVVLIDSPCAVLDAIEREHPELLASSVEGLSQSYRFTDGTGPVAAVASRWLEKSIEVEKAAIG
jgi:glutamate racemase